jgi:MFS family permease
MIKSLLAIYKDAYRGLPRMVWLLSIVSLIHRAGTMVVPFLILYLTQEFEYSVIDAGSFLAVYGVGAMVGSYWGGWLCDQFSSKWAQIGCLLLAGGGLIALGEVSSHTGLMVVIGWTGLWTESFRPAANTAIGEFSTPENRTRSFALNRLAINLGMTVGPAVGGFLALTSYHFLFWVDGISSFAAALFLLFLQDSPPRKNEGKKGTKTLAKSPYADWVFMTAMCFSLLMGIVCFQMVGTYPLFLKEYCTFDEGDIGLLFTGNTVLIILFEMILIRYLEQFHTLRVVAIGALFFCGGFGLLAFHQATWFVIFSLVIWTLGEMMVAPVLVAFVANRADSDSMGKYMGVFSLSFSGGFALAPIVGTAIYGRQSPEVLWLACGLVGILSCIAYLFLATQYQPSKS